MVTDGDGRFLVVVTAVAAVPRVVSLCTIEPLIDRIKSFGWDVDKIDGNDINQILQSGFSARDKPKVILGYTDPAKGIEILKDRPDALHYVRFAHPFEKIKYKIVNHLV